jgi:hypothetical protein
VESETVRGGQETGVIQSQAGQPTTRYPFMRTDVVRSTVESQVSQRESSRVADWLSSSLFDTSGDVMMTMLAL